LKVIVWLGITDMAKAKSFIPKIRPLAEQPPRLRLGIYEGLVVQEDRTFSKYSGRPFKKVQVKLDNGRRVWAVIHPKRYAYDYLGLRVTIDARHEKWWNDDYYTRYYVFLGKWDDYGAY
jgi:hypothetical protein